MDRRAPATSSTVGVAVGVGTGVEVGVGTGVAVGEGTGVAVWVGVGSGVAVGMDESEHAASRAMAARSASPAQ